MFGLSFWELGVVLVVALLALGPKRLPEVLRSLGRGMRELRRASAGLREAIEEPLEEMRGPLREMRDDVANSFYKAGRELEDEVRKEIDADAQRIEAEIDSPLMAAAAAKQIAPPLPTDDEGRPIAPQGDAPWARGAEGVGQPGASAEGPQQVVRSQPSEQDESADDRPSVPPLPPPSRGDSR